jgi:hypothetical protein
MIKLKGGQLMFHHQNFGNNHPYHVNRFVPPQTIQRYIGKTIRTHILGYGDVVAYVHGIDPVIGIVSLIIFLPHYGQQQYAHVHLSNIASIHPYFEGTLTNTDPVIEIYTDKTWTGASEISAQSAWYKPTVGSWVWSTDTKSDKAFITKEFTINDPRKIIQASLFFAVDNYGEVTINGKTLFKDQRANNTTYFNPGRTFKIDKDLFQRKNSVIIEGFNYGFVQETEPSSSSNPAGIYAKITIQTRS